MIRSFIFSFILLVFVGCGENYENPNKNLMLKRISEAGIKQGIKYKELMDILNKMRPRHYELYDRSNFYDWWSVFYLNEDWRLYVTYKKERTLMTEEYRDIHEIQTLELKGIYDYENKFSKDIFPYIRLLYRTQSITEVTAYNPTTLIRAVNEFHAIGKKKTLKVLFDSIDDSNINIGDRSKIHCILLFLFVRKKASIEKYHLSFGLYSSRIYRNFTSKEIDQNWPFWPITLEDDFPFFLLESDFTTATHSSLEEDHLKFCEKYCEIRDKPLHPKANPLVIANELFKNEKWLKFFVETREKPFDNPYFSIRKQALLAVSSVYTVNSKEELERCTDEQWQRHLEEFGKLNVVWDPVINDYKLKE